MGNCRTLCRYLAQEGLPPDRVMTKLNAALAVDNPACMFVTLIQGTYDPASGHLVFASAGHPPPLVRRASGKVEELPVTSGRLLGYPGQESAFVLHHVQLEPGDAIVFFTDGLVEARSPVDKILFGPERTFELVQSFAAGQNLADWADETRDRVSKFLGGQTLSDDLTLLLLRRRR
jgi:sigma-B regulation protein RsbU (phosphoserine phosphatase)